MQILIVEDEHKIAAFLKRGLKEEHYNVDIAFDGEEALYKFDINQYDLVWPCNLPIHSRSSQGPY